VLLGEEWPSHAWSSKSVIGSLALYSCVAMVERARWLVITPRASVRGTFALRQKQRDENAVDMACTHAHTAISEQEVDRLASLAIYK
jgi:hypothetical protein